MQQLRPRQFAPLGVRTSDGAGMSACGGNRGHSSGDWACVGAGAALRLPSALEGPGELLHGQAGVSDDPAKSAPRQVLRAMHRYGNAAFCGGVCEGDVAARGADVFGPGTLRTGSLGNSGRLRDCHLVYDCLSRVVELHGHAVNIRGDRDATVLE